MYNYVHAVASPPMNIVVRIIIVCDFVHYDYS